MLIPSSQQRYTKDPITREDCVALWFGLTVLLVVLFAAVNGWF